jgi:hypothetical protein
MSRFEASWKDVPSTSAPSSLPLSNVTTCRPETSPGLRIEPPCEGASDHSIEESFPARDPLSDGVTKAVPKEGKKAPPGDEAEPDRTR